MRRLKKMLSDKNELINVVQSLLFVSGQGIEIKDIAEKLEVSEVEVKKAVEVLKENLANEGINVITYKNSVQLCSNPKYAEDIATVLNPIREKLLTKAAMETMAIVAYKQPVTRLDVEQIRGVSSDYALQVLINFKLVEVVGRKDAIGKPLLFGTTNEFLKRFELQNISDLPDYDELLERIAVLHMKVNDELYGSTQILEEDFTEENDEKLIKEEIIENFDETLSVESNKERDEKESESLRNNNQNKNEQKTDKNQDVSLESEDSESNVEQKSELQFDEEETKNILLSNLDSDDVLDSKEKDLL